MMVGSYGCSRVEGPGDLLLKHQCTREAPGLMMLYLVHTDMTGVLQLLQQMKLDYCAHDEYIFGASHFISPSSQLARSLADSQSHRN